MTRRPRRLRLLLVLAVLLLLALEVVVRVAGLVDIGTGVATPHQAAFNAADMFVTDDDPELSYRNRPDALATVEGIEYRHDARGRRVLPAAGDAPGDATGTAGATGTEHAPRVAFLGDSTTYGLGLTAADTLPAQVGAALGGAIVPLDLGTCGYGSAQEAALYAAEREQMQGVALVVLVVFPNDFAPGTFRWDSSFHVMYLDPLPLPHALKGALWNSALYRWIVSGVAKARFAAGEYDPLNPVNRGPTLAAVKELAELVAADGRRLLVAHLPAMERLDPYYFHEPVAALAGACAEAQLPYVDLLEAFLAERERQSAEYAAHFGKPPEAAERAGFLAQYWLDHPRDHHLNALATRLAANALATRIAELLSLPPPAR